MLVRFLCVKFDVYVGAFLKCGLYQIARSFSLKSFCKISVCVFQLCFCHHYLFGRVKLYITKESKFFEKKNKKLSF